MKLCAIWRAKLQSELLNNQLKGTEKSCLVIFHYKCCGTNYPNVHDSNNFFVI